MSRLLLYTHVVLWWFAANSRLLLAAREEIASGESWLSAFSFWEVAIKIRLGKLPVASDALLAEARDGNCGR
mgnify:CR=1 FL=1